MHVDKRALSFIGFVATLVGVVAFCRLLLLLSQFGATPFPELPMAVIAMTGVLFVGVLHPLSRRLSMTLAFAAAATGLVAGAVVALQMPSWGGSSQYLLAAVTAVAWTLALRAMPRRRGPMFAAMTVYVMCTLLANYTFDSFLPLGDFFLVNVGTFFFGVTFTQRDTVHQFGRRAVYAMIGAAALANVALALSLGTPLRYVAVGFLAILLSETADTEVYQRLLKRRWLTRVASSNAISAPLDTIVFTVLAFTGMGFATAQWMLQVIVTDVIVKYASGMLAAFGIVLTTRRREAEAPLEAA